MSPLCIAYSATVACNAKICAVCEIAVVRPGTHGQATAIGDSMLQATQTTLVEEDEGTAQPFRGSLQPLGLTPQARTVPSLPQL